MTAMPLVVIGGIPQLRDALEATGLFPRVLHAASTRELLGTITSDEVRQCGVRDLVFVFADTLTQDDPSMPLSEILRRLTSAGYQVVVVTVTPKGAELQRQNPQAGLLTLPLSVNEVLFAIGTYGYVVDPLPDGFTPIEIGADLVLGQAAHQTAADVPVSPVEDAPGASPSLASTPASTPAAPPNGWQIPEPTEALPPTPPSPPAQPTREQVPNPFTAASPGAPTAPPVTAAIPHSNSAAFTATPTPPAVPPLPGLTPLAPSGAATPSLTPPAPAWTGGATSPTAFAPAVRAGHDSGRGIGQPPRRGFVTTIAVSKGGVGKSSMTLNLAAFLGMRLRAQGKTVCVIDANYQQADSGKYLDTYTPNINTIVNNPALLAPERIMEALVHKPEYNLSVLLGPATPDEGNPLAISARLYNEILELLKSRFDYIFIDTPVAEKFHEMFSDFALPRADYIVVPVAPNFTTLHNADNWLRAAVVAPRHLGGAGLEASRIGIVLNRAEDGIGCSEDDVRQTMASWHFLGSIPETKEWKACNNRNELVAPRNYAELSQAFAEVLHAATGEPVLLENLAAAPKPRSGLGAKLKSMLGRSS